MANLTGSTQVFHSNTDTIDTSAKVALGTRGYDMSGNEYIYLKGVGSTAQGSWVVYDEDHATTLIVANEVGPVAIAMAAINAITSYGWYQIFGKNTVAKTDTVAADAALYIDGTAGRADDAGVAGDIILGAYSMTADTSNVATVYITYPHISNDLGGSSGSVGGADTQVQFNDGGSLNGDAGFTYNKTTDVATIGGLILSGLTASEMIGTDASKNLVSLAVATYPSLTELTYLKGVTSAIQTQFTGKAATDQTMYIGTTAVAINRASAALTLAGLTLTTPDIGTPSAGTLTNCTGLPVAGIAASTVTALGVGSLELGHATDTTFTRVSAGVAAIEGNNIVVNTSSPTLGTITTTGNIELGHASDTTISRSAAGVIAVEGVVIPSISSTNTFTNKRITKRIGTTTSHATPTINTDNVDFYSLTAQTEAITSFTTNLSGTPTENQTLWIAITGTAARAITWGASFEASTVALPTTTVTTNRLDVGFVWNTVTSKWRCIASA